ncbi:MAG: CCA tRNA nucleotidyltransferase [Thermoplasmata archaeon]|nr:CCA tRNA nucleotidyltransferase [Thermoplasmata archaeon]
MSGPHPPTPLDADAVEREVRERISPDAATLDHVARTAEKLVERARAAARGRAVEPKQIVVAGSAARGTFLRDRLDIDLFFLYPPTLSRGDLEREGLALAAAILEAPETRYAEHPYLRGKFEGFAVDAVPGYAVTDPSQPLSAVDRTPFHQAFLKERQTPTMVADVRLLKQFLRGHGLYGSEARTGGFSGYVVELLVLRFASFHRVLVEAARWTIPTRIQWNPASAPRVPDDVALIMDDPVDPQRNVATALSRRNLAAFILSAQAFVDRPDRSAFEVHAPVGLPLADAVRRVEGRGTHVTALTLPRPAVVDDVLYPQIRKAQRAVSEEAERLGFSVLGTAGAAGLAHVLVLIEASSRLLPAVRRRPGPPPGIDRVGSFLDKWTAPGAGVVQGPYLDDSGQLAVETEREERSLEGLLREALPRLPLGRDLKEGVASGSWIGPLSELADRPEAGVALAELLDKRLPWVRAPRA